MPTPQGRRWVKRQPFIIEIEFLAESEMAMIPALIKRVRDQVDEAIRGLRLPDELTASSRKNKVTLVQVEKKNKRKKRKPNRFIY
jgi:hypothetical protein